MFRSAPVVEQKGGGIGVRFTGFTRVGREGGDRSYIGCGVSTSVNTIKAGTRSRALTFTHHPRSGEVYSVPTAKTNGLCCHAHTYIPFVLL